MIVIGQVLSDARQIRHHRDAERSQASCTAHTGQLQQLGRLDCASRQDDIQPRCSGAQLAVLEEFHPACSRALKHHAASERVGLGAQTVPTERRAQIRDGGAAALAAPGRNLQPPDPFVAGAVVVRVGRNADAMAGFHEGVGHLVTVAEGFDRYRTSPPAQRRVAAGKILHPAQHRLNRLPVPAGAAGVGPCVVARGIATHPIMPLAEIDPPRTLPRGQ